MAGKPAREMAAGLQLFPDMRLLTLYFCVLSANKLPHRHRVRRRMWGKNWKPATISQAEDGGLESAIEYWLI